MTAPSALTNPRPTTGRLCSSQASLRINAMSEKNAFTGPTLGRGASAIRGYLWCPVWALSKRQRTEPDEHLAHILSREQAEQCLGCVLEAIDNGFLPLDLPVDNPCPHVGV